MKQPEVEFFSEDIEGNEYLNVGFKFYVPGSDEPVRCVLGAFGVAPEEEGLRIIKALVEEAAGYMLEACAAAPAADAGAKSGLILPARLAGSANVEG